MEERPLYMMVKTPVEYLVPMRSKMIVMAMAVKELVS